MKGKNEDVRQKKVSRDPRHRKMEKQEMINFFFLLFNIFSYFPLNIIFLKGAPKFFLFVCLYDIKY